MSVIKGNFVFAESFGDLTAKENQYLVYDQSGIRGFFQELPEAYRDEVVESYGDALIIPSFSDMHLHAPQYPMLGMGLDLPLLEWLETYTFPTEEYFEDPELARKVYRKLAHDLVENGTTHVAMFSSIHVTATLILMEELEKAGITGFVGKVNMDRNNHSRLMEDTQESLKETERWLEESKRFKKIKPIITPRFTPSCSDELMKGLGKLAAKYDLPIQSHLSENTNEIRWVKDLCPDCQEYWDSYAKYGLWNEKTLMAHCVHSSDRELQAMKDAGVYVVHCPSSNENLTSGYAPARYMIEKGVRVVLGSDIAGGDHLSMFENVAAAIRASKARLIMDEKKPVFLRVEEAFYLATGATAEFFGEKAGFVEGAPFHAIVLKDDQLPTVRALSLQERFERAMYLRQKDAIVAVYNQNKLIFKR